MEDHHVGRRRATLDLFDDGALSGAESGPVPQPSQDVVESCEGPKAQVRVVIERCFVLASAGNTGKGSRAVDRTRGHTPGRYRSCASDFLRTGRGRPAVEAHASLPGAICLTESSFACIVHTMGGGLTGVGSATSDGGPMAAMWDADGPVSGGHP